MKNKKVQTTFLIQFLLLLVCTSVLGANLVLLVKYFDVNESCTSVEITLTNCLQDWFAGVPILEHWNSWNNKRPGDEYLKPRLSMFDVNYYIERFQVIDERDAVRIAQDEYGIVFGSDTHFLPTFFEFGKARWTIIGNAWFLVDEGFVTEYDECPAGMNVRTAYLEINSTTGMGHITKKCATTIFDYPTFTNY